MILRLLAGLSLLLALSSAADLGSFIDPNGGTESDYGCGIDPNGGCHAQEAGWGIDPNGASTDGGPGMDPNG